jgi:hypothetical protein
MSLTMRWLARMMHFSRHREISLKNVLRKKLASREIWVWHKKLLTMKTLLNIVSDFKIPIVKKTLPSHKISHSEREKAT